MGYHAFICELTGLEYGSFETFRVTKDQAAAYMLDGTDIPAGWYWQACFPGCLPDGEPSGPFGSEVEAIRDAQGGY